MLRVDFATLLEKEMDRKDFLKHIGIAIIGITGVAAVLSSLAGQNAITTASKQNRSYGFSDYGGTK